jgi:hypothetical protein
MINAIKSKILGILILFCAIALIKIAGDNFIHSTIVLVLTMVGMIFLKHREIKNSLPNELRGKMIKNGAMSILWGVLFFIAPSYFLYEDYLFSYKSTNHVVTVSKSTEMVCSYGRRKSSSRTEEPCWNIEYQIEGKTFERRMHTPTKKGDKFSAVYVANWNDGIRYEKPIEDRNAYFINQISILQVFFYILSVYKIVTGLMLIGLSKLATGSLISNLGIGKNVGIAKESERKEPSL